MADATVTTPGRTLVTQPDYIYSEKNPFERICARLNGLEALTCVMPCAMDSPEGGSPTQPVWNNLFFALGVMSEDIKRDLYELDQRQAAGVRP